MEVKLEQHDGLEEDMDATLARWVETAEATYYLFLNGFPSYYCFFCVVRSLKYFHSPEAKNSALAVFSSDIRIAVLYLAFAKSSVCRLAGSSIITTL